MQKPLVITIQENCQGLIDATQPNTGNNADALLHEMFVAKEAKSFFEKKHDAMKELVIDQFINRDDLVDGAKFVAVQGQKYLLDVKINNGSSSLNKTKLKMALVTKLGLSEGEVEQMLEECSDAKSGAKYFTVQPVI
jgi:hypothetical protein